jgi:Na+-driven multidrug efflux pump
MWGNLVGFLLNVTLNYVLMKAMGVAGIALSTALVLMVAFFYLAICSHRIVRKNELPDPQETGQCLEITT